MYGMPDLLSISVTFPLTFSDFKVQNYPNVNIIIKAVLLGLQIYNRMNCASGGKERKIMFRNIFSGEGD